MTRLTGDAAPHWVALASGDVALIGAVRDAMAAAGVAVRVVGVQAADASDGSASSGPAPDSLLTLWGGDWVTDGNPCAPGDDDVLLLREGRGAGQDQAALWAAAAQLGLAHVAVLPPGLTWLVEHVVRACEPRGRASTVIGVRGCSPGVGATSLSIALALACARRGWQPLLIEALPAGAIHQLMRLDARDGRTWRHFLGAEGSLLAADTGSLPTALGVTVLGWPVGDPGFHSDVKALPLVLRAASKAHRVVIVDCGSLRGAGAAGPTSALPTSTRWVILAANTVRGVRDAAAVSAVGRALRPGPSPGPSLGASQEHAVVVRDVGGTLPSPLVAKALGSSAAFPLRHDRRLPAEEDMGRIPGSRRRSTIRRCAERVLAHSLGTDAR